MGLFDSEARRDKRDARDAQRAELVKKVEDKLLEAAEAGQRGDILAEEVAIQEASFIAASGKTLTWNPYDDFTKMLLSLAERKKVRAAGGLGFVGQTWLFGDRIVCLDEISRENIEVGIHLLDSSAKADVMTEGELRTTSRPTLTRMAMGSVLPGSALIPGFAFQKKETTDERRLFFTIEQHDWGKIVELDPKQVDIAEIRQLAMNFNQTAAQLKKNPEASPEQELASAADRIRELAKLRDEGLINEQEFEQKRQALLDQL